MSSILLFCLDWPAGTLNSQHVRRSLKLITLPLASIHPNITKTETNNCFIIQCLKESKITTNAMSYGTQLILMPLTTHELDIALENHALRAHSTD